MNCSDLIYKIGLTFLPGVGDINAKNLVSYCGGAAEVFKVKRGKLLKIPGIGDKTAEAIVKSDVLKRAEEELKFVEKNGITPLFFLDEAYPKRLKHCNDSPILMYYKGNADLNNAIVVGIVGTRKATEYGKGQTEKIVADLKKYNVLILSGLAYGIDHYAHKAAIKEDIPNVGVLGHGLDRIYPAAHRETAAKMIKNGGLLTEFPSQTLPDRENFPKRNRIVAGMSDAVILVESDISGGAVITANLADSYNRDVFALPGRITDKYSSGCNYLLQTQRAQIFIDADSMAMSMGWINQPVQRKQQRELIVDLSEDEKKVIEVFKEKELWVIDDLVMQLNMPTSKISALLLELELKGMVTSLPGKKFSLM